MDQTALMLMGAAVRSLEIAGSLEAMLDITVRYANERVAFEQTIAKFQAVQHNLARLAGEIAAAMAAASSAADTIAHAAAFDDAVFLEAPSAKIRCAEAAEKGAAIAHQVHGAIGFTLEHILHRYTLRRWPGGTISATRATGRWSWATLSPPAAPTNCGRCWPRADPGSFRMQQSRASR